MAILQKGLISGDAGHNCIPDKGASGIRVEDELTKAVWLLVQAKLKAHGYTVIDCTPYGQTFNSVSGALAYRVQVSNRSGAIFHLCIHFNAGGGKGVEAWVIALGGTAETYAKQLCAEIAKLGYVNRGVKVGNLYVPKYTNAPCVLLEVAFVDSQEDMNRYTAESISEAIIKAMTGESETTVAVQPVAAVAPKVVNTTPVVNTGINANAVIVNDWFYVRDSAGNIIPGRVDIGDEVEIIDISYSKQLVLVKYPTASGSRTEYIKNVPANINYKHYHEWRNGSTSEAVYQDSACTIKIGSLSPGEYATPLYRRNGVLCVAYKTNLGENTKSGFVKYNDNFSEF